LKASFLYAYHSRPVNGYLAAYLGKEGEKEVPDRCDLEDEPDVMHLLNRMLRKARYGVPTPQLERTW
jgi:hypothetical protein